MKTYLTLFFVALLFSCGTSKKATETAKEETEKIESPTAKLAILSQDIAKFRDTQPYNITSVFLQDNVLQMDINYNGGCAEHEFELVGSSFITKSLPPKRIIQLYHHKSDDDCRELINETIYFDISPLAYRDSEIVLEITHYKDVIKYTRVNSK